MFLSRWSLRRCSRATSWLCQCASRQSILCTVGLCSTVREIVQGGTPVLKNIYAPLAGGMAQERVLEILSNNVANIHTTGFKEEEVTFRSMMPDPWPSYPSALPPVPFAQRMEDVYPPRGNEMGSVGVAEVKTNFRPGALQTTGNALDVALEGDGFFVLETPFGPRYTRDGSFTLSPEGLLMSKTGGVVQGSRGPISGLNEGELRILRSGEVYAGERFVDTLKVVDVSNRESLQRLGDNVFVYDGDPAGITPQAASVQQRMLEASNVNPMKNLTGLILAHRSYEAMQKAIRAHDESMQLGASKIPEVNP